MSIAVSATAPPVMRALMLPLQRGDVVWPRDGKVLFLGAHADAGLDPLWPGLLCEQSFRPVADVLEHRGFHVGQPAWGQTFALVLLLLPRQRDARRVQLARAMTHLAAGGTLLAAVANHEGARSFQDDAEQLLGAVQSLSKHKCRALWVSPDRDRVNTALLDAWRGLDALRPTVEGLVSRPGLFAWDRVDAASRLLAEHFAHDLGGDAADFGAGAGYLSVQLVRRCPQVRRIALYEADARALPAAQQNLQHACADRAHAPSVAVHWHDVAAGVPDHFDVIVSNPPFHQGHADDPQLGQAFITAAATALRAGGRFLLVANRHLPYEATLRSRFAHDRVLADRDGFKVIEAWH